MNERYVIFFIVMFCIGIVLGIFLLNKQSFMPVGSCEANGGVLVRTVGLNEDACIPKSLLIRY